MKKNNLLPITLSKVEAPKFNYILKNNRVTNGDSNSYYQYIKDCYLNSPTNSSIINAIANYIVAEGLIDLKTGNYIHKLLSRQCMRLIALDYKLYGGFALQILWNSATNIEDKRVVKIKHIAVNKLALNIDEDMEVDGYWFSFDWDSAQYTPKFYHKFDGEYKDYDEENADIEIIMFQRPSVNDFYSQPDYQSGLIYAEIEGEMSQDAISNIQNGFVGGSIINCNAGIPPTDEVKNEYKKQIINGLTGSKNSQKVIISFNENAEQAMTIDRIPLQDVNEQNKIYDETAEQKLIVSHSVPPILFEGIRSGGGFSSNSEEIQTATQALYRKVINPMREVILDGLEFVFSFMDADIELGFKDFESFVEKEVIEEVKNDGEVREEVKIKE